NGFVLLIVGALITSFLVPYYQRKYEERKQKRDTRNECLRQFLLASNLIWQEWFLLGPLTQKTVLSGEEYSKALEQINGIRIKRYDAFATVEALAVAYRERREEKAVEEAIDDYAVRVNQISHNIDRWLRTLRCADGGCAPSSEEPPA